MNLKAISITCATAKSGCLSRIGSQEESSLPQWLLLAVSSPLFQSNLNDLNVCPWAEQTLLYFSEIAYSEILNLYYKPIVGIRYLIDTYT